MQDPSRRITPRGTINVKGKDLPMETFWINEKSANGEKKALHSYHPVRTSVNGEKDK